MEMLGPLLLLTLLGVTLGQTSIQSSCLTVNGELVCYNLYDAGPGNTVAYHNNLCSTGANPEGSLATIENVEVMDLVHSWSTAMDDSGGEVRMWIAGEKFPDDLYFRTKTGRILPINDWQGESLGLDDHYCATISSASHEWSPRDCSNGGETHRYYLCQDKTDTCPVEDACDRQTPYERNLDEWCFWPYDLRLQDYDSLYSSYGGYLHCLQFGGKVMSIHNTEELANINDIIAGFYIQGASESYNEGFTVNLMMHDYNYRWNNGWAAVGLKELGMEDEGTVYLDRDSGYEHGLVMTLNTDPISQDILKFDRDFGAGGSICEAKRVDLCLFHAFKAPHAEISINLEHVLYNCEQGYQFSDGNTTKLFDCSCDVDALVNITRDISCEPIPYCEDQVQVIGAECECPPGYKWDESGIVCEDIDECELRNGGCDQICQNTDGSFECGCWTGFEPHPNMTNLCKDVDECRDGQPCPDDSFCENAPGSFNCLCQRGFVLNDATSTCDDVNECEEMPDICGDNSRCINRYGSYLCDCESGYRLTDNDRCEDVDECSWKHPPCSHNCTNKDGDFECSCPSGYELDTNFGTTCIDIDECKVDYGSCSGNQQCENTPGSFQCECHDGFRLNAFGVCSDIDECSENLHTCRNDEQCFNMMGSYVCHCAEGQLRTSNRECINPYSTTDMVFSFRTECTFRPEYEDRSSPEFASIYRAIEQQYFLLAEQRLVESSFRLNLSPSGGGGTLVEATIGVPFVPDLDLTRDVLMAVYRAMRNNNYVLYLQGQTCPLVRQVSYRTPQNTGIWDFSNICAIYDSLDYCENGPCEVDQGLGQPRCRCPQGFSGERCDEETGAAPSMWTPLTIGLLAFAGFVALLLLTYILCQLLTRGGRVSRPRPVGPPVKRAPQYSPWNAFRPPLGRVPGAFALRG